jgi:exodeoxyribonuclease-3
VRLRVVSYNIRIGGWGREDAIAGVLKSCEADLVVLEEAIRPDVVERLARVCGMNAHGSLRGHSLAFLSRTPVARYAWHGVRFARRRYLEIVLEGSGARIFGVHLSAIHSNVFELRRAYELRSLLAGVAAHQHGFHVLTGDFNTLAPGEELDIRKLPSRLRAVVWATGGRISWRTIQLMLDGGYIDSYRMFHQDDGYTFPTWDPHVRLDYAFVPAVFAGRVGRCKVVRNAPGVRDASDHFPLLFEIEI